MSLRTIMRTIVSFRNCVIKIIFALTFFSGILLVPFSALSQTPPEAAKTFTVVIDAGHGGKDPGAMGKISREKDIALSIALKTGDYISSLMPDVKVIYTRTTDYYVDLYRRADIAIENKADLFLSIHVNGNNNSAIYGAETYVMGPSKSERNFELAKKENSVILLEDDKTKYEGFDPNDQSNYIMFSVMQNTYLNQSLLMASQVQDQMRIRAKRKDGGVRQGPFLVLWRTTMPSVLVETGYISNIEEEKYLSTDNGQDIIASSIYRAFRNYKEETEAKTAVESKNLESQTSDEAEADKTADPVIEEKIAEKPIEKEVKDTLKETNPVKQIKEVAEEKRETNLAENSAKLVFRVQLIASKSPIKSGSEHFKGVTGLHEVQIDGYYKYMTDAFETYSQSQEARQKLLPKFPGAFIIAFLDGVKIPLPDAIKMEKEK